jgi:hypothetical protein
MNDEFDPVIFRYTREQALEDGILVDFTDWARETGFKVPVACTRAVWEGYVVPPEGMRKMGQSERGRAHDVLWMLYNEIHRTHESDSDTLHFKVIFLGTAARPQSRLMVELKTVCGPGDDAEPVLTIMLPDED